MSYVYCTIWSLDWTGLSAVTETRKDRWVLKHWVCIRQLNTLEYEYYRELWSRGGNDSPSHREGAFPTECCGWGDWATVERSSILFAVEDDGARPARRDPNLKQGLDKVVNVSPLSEGLKALSKNRGNLQTGKNWKHDNLTVQIQRE